MVLFTLLLFIFQWSELSIAQDVEGALTGIVEDTSGARVARARVLLSVPDSPFQRQTVSNSVGEFRLEALPPGEYRVEVSASGFAVSNLKLHVAVSSNPTITVRLKLQASAEKIDVEGIGKPYHLPAVRDSMSIFPWTVATIMTTTSVASCRTTRQMPWRSFLSGPRSLMPTPRALTADL